MLVNIAFTGPRGPTDEAFTMKTPPRVLRMLLKVPITMKCKERPDMPLIWSKIDRRMRPKSDWELNDRLKASKPLTTTSCFPCKLLIAINTEPRIAIPIGAKG